MQRVSRLHKIILTCLCSALLLSLCAVSSLSSDSSSGSASSPSELVPARFKAVAENQYLQLYLDFATTEIAVVDRSSGRVWYSNPADPRAEGQLTIEYYTPQDAMRRMNNFADSVKLGQFEIKEIDGGVRIDFVLGQSWTDKDYMPTFISKDRFEQLILSGIENEKDREFVRNNYVQISLEEAPADFERVSVAQVDKEALFGKYAMKIATEPEGKARSNFIRHVLDQYRLERADIDSITKVTPEIIEPLIGTPTMVVKPSLWPWDRESTAKIIRSSGYHPLDKQHDNQMYNIDPLEAPVEVFTIPVEYRLEEDSLVVRVPMQDVRYPKDVYTSQQWGLRGVHWLVVEDEYLMKAFGRIEGETVTFPLHAMSVLRFFGTPAAQQAGYILIPDGSGALINLAASRKRLTGDMTLQLPIYGQDLSNIGSPADALLEYELQRYFERLQLPVFGMNQGDAGFIGIVEAGDALASIVVETSGTVNPVDAVYARFKVIPVGTVQLAESSRGGGGAYINTYQDRLPESDLQVRYLFLDGEQAGYAGMARRFQQYLVDRYSLEKVAPQQSIPFYLELVGGVHRQKPIMGVPRQVVEPLTTHEQVKAVIQEVQDRGIRNIVLRYTGWLEGGVDHVYPSKVFLEPTLGTRQSFMDMAGYLEDRGVEYYLDVTQTVVAKSRQGDGFREGTHVAYSLNKYPQYTVLPSGAAGGVLSVARLHEQVDGFLADCSRYEIKGLALRDLGISVNSDFQRRVEKLIDRQQARDIIAGAVAKMADQKTLMIDGANLYALIHAEHVLNMPIGNSGFVIADAEVPFYQMVTRGYVNYAGLPVNQGSDLQDTFLKSLEIGAYPYFLWGYRDPSILKDTPFHYLLSTDYRTWLDFASRYYEALNRVLQPLQGQTIVDHKRLANQVYETTYENGTRIVVNYGDEPVQVGNRSVGARNYIVIEGETE